MKMVEFNVKNGAGRVLLPDAALTEWLAGMSRRDSRTVTEAAYLFQRWQGK